MPRTPDGHPDLQGNWTNATLTPLERRSGQGPLLTPEDVVETANFHPLQLFRGNSSDNMKVIERFSRVDQETILYEFTVDDPTTYVEPWGGEIPMKVLNDRLYEYACHEGNYSLEGVLSGARYRERIEAGSQDQPK